MMHTGFCSQIKKSEVGNLKILLEILGCCPEMGFSINMMNENSKLVKLANLDGNEQITNSGKTMISKNAVLTRKCEKVTQLDEDVHSNFLYVPSCNNERTRGNVNHDHGEQRAKKRFIVHL